MARVLVLFYSQTGQQKEIVDSVLQPIIKAGHEVHVESIRPVENFSFPWSGLKFFNSFPETFFQKPIALEKPSEKTFKNYDLVILGYQPWFLTPSRPVSSFLLSDDGKKILSGKKVVTLIGCRNMWLGAQEKVKAHLLKANAQLVGNIALDDRSGNLTSLITIIRWMFTGKKNPFFIFPAAGVSNQDIAKASVFGDVINEALRSQSFENIQAQLLEKGAIIIRPSLVLMERRGQRGFGLWSKFIAGGGAPESSNRKMRVRIFMVVLPTVIILLTPLLIIVSSTMLVLLKNRLRQEIEYFKGISFRG